jgi:mannose-1-phosphate guanylyltransferase
VAVIMAGGVGERFWPLSRRDYPKQLLRLTGSETLLDLALRRLEPLIPTDHIFVVTTATLAPAIREHTPHLNPRNLLLEPEGKNTAASLALAVAAIEQRHGPSVMAVATADHLIGEEDRFRSTMERAMDLAEAHDQLIVFGVRPTHPETGYGYIELGEVVDHHPELPCHSVLHFREKPDQATAARYVNAGNFLWNSGMFAWQTQTLRRAFAEHAEPHSRALSQMDQIRSLAGEHSEALAPIFAALPNLSIDFAVLDHAENIWALPVAFPWIDIGSWESVREMLPPDAMGNAKRGEIITVDTRGSTLYSTGPLIAACGVEDVVVVATPDAVLVCPRGRVQEIKAVVAALSAERKESHL